MNPVSPGAHAPFRNRALLGGLALFVLAAALMRLSAAPGVRSEARWIAGPAPGDPPLPGRLWQPADEAKAVILLGHGVSCNQGVMAAAAKAYAGQGYAALAFDFWGHGRVRAPMDWRRNPEVVEAWLAWARAAYPGLPVAYLGHSMGAGAGDGLLRAGTAAPDAFLSMGSLPARNDAAPTLIATGRFEELFTPAQARERAGDWAETLVSPWSNHALETWDPVLIQGMIDWTDRTLGTPPAEDFSWARWHLALIATVIGSLGALLAAAGLAGLLRGASLRVDTGPGGKGWRLNPYLPAARLFGAPRSGARARQASAARAIGAGLVFGGAAVALLILLLDRDIFSCRPDHPARLLAWAAGALIAAGPLWLDAALLDRAVGGGGGLRRFAAAALTRGAPLLVIGAALWFQPGPIAFLGMMFGVLAFIAAMIALVQALAQRAVGDPRTAACAAAVLLPWVFAFWFPVTW